MKRISARRSLLTLTMAATIAVPLSTAAIPAHAASRASIVSLAASRTYNGSVQQMDRWGPIEASIVVSNKKITRVIVSATAHTGRSVQIQNAAIPLLKSETLKAQSANIDLLSRATDTSTAYVASLTDAVKRARTAKALK